MDKEVEKTSHMELRDCMKGHDQAGNLKRDIMYQEAKSKANTIQTMCEAFVELTLFAPLCMIRASHYGETIKEEAVDIVKKNVQSYWALFLSMNLVA